MSKISESHKITFPNESKEYRSKRLELLEVEAELRQKLEEVASLRRELLPGGEIKEDDIFDELKDGRVEQVRMSDLFETGKNSLFVYGFMFGPDAKNPCPMCTVLLDSLNGSASYFQQRANLVVVARAPIEKVQSFADSRGWNNLRMLSSQGNSFNPDYQSEAENGAQMPMANVFTKTNGKVHHFWAPEVFYVPIESDPRHMDLIFPLWNLLDFTPEGRGSDWMPKVF